MAIFRKSGGYVFCFDLWNQFVIFLMLERSVPRTDSREQSFLLNIDLNFALIVLLVFFLMVLEIIVTFDPDFLMFFVS